MNFLILTQYYPPETGAPQNRLHALAKNLVLQGHSVRVLTAMPSYPKSEIFRNYKNKLFHKEIIDGILVYRSWIFITQKKTIPFRLLSYFSFVVSSRFLGRKIKEIDYIFCESPPLFLSYSAYSLAKKLNAKVIFNVSDLWPKSARDLGIVTNKPFLWLASRLEKNSYKKAYKVTAQTQGIINDLSERFSFLTPHWMPNGVDPDAFLEKKFDENWKNEFGLTGKKIFIYAGLLGLAQGMDVIINAAKNLLEHDEIRFVVVGDGPDKNRLMSLNSKLGARVIFIPSMPRVKVISLIGSSYGFLVPLKKIKLFEGAIPSKIFDALALKVPILLGVEGEAKHLFIDKCACGLAYQPENDLELSQKILELSSDSGRRNFLGETGYRYVFKYFNQKNIVKDFLNLLD